MKIRLTLLIALVALSLAAGCSKPQEDTVNTTPPANASGGSAPAPGAPGTAPTTGTAEPLPAGAQGQMSNALNDPNTPPHVKEQIRQQMGGR